MENTENKRSVNEVEFIKEQKQATHPNYKKVCLYCGREFHCVRIDAKFCTTLCRAKYNQDKGKKGEKMNVPASSANGYRSFDFTCLISGYPEDKEWKEFRGYLFKKFGWKKTETSTYKDIKYLVDDWNDKHDEQITLRKEREKHGTRVIFSVN